MKTLVPAALALAVSVLSMGCKNTPSQAYLLADQVRNGIVERCLPRQRLLNVNHPAPNNKAVAKFKVNGDPDCVRETVRDFRTRTQGCDIGSTRGIESQTEVKVDCSKIENAQSAVGAGQ